jgi:hypothetical protein
MLTCFACGIIGTGLLAIPVLAGSGAYALAELMEWKEGLEHKAGLPGSQSPISRPRARQVRAPARRNRVLKRYGPQRGALGMGEAEGVGPTVPPS